MTRDRRTGQNSLTLLQSGCVLYALTVPFETVVPKWLPTTLQGNLSITRIAGLYAIMTFALSCQSLVLEFPAFIKCCAMFAVAICLTSMVSGAIELDLLSQQVQGIMSCVVIYNACRASRFTIKAVLVAVGVSAAFCGMLTIGGYTVDTMYADELGGRISAFGSDPNIFGGMIAVAVVCLVGAGDEDEWRSKLLLGICAVGYVVATSVIVSTSSRGATLSLVIGSLTLIKGIRKRIQYAPLLVCVGVLLLANSGEVRRFVGETLLSDRILATIEDGESSGRVDIWNECVHMIAERPLVGWGSDAWLELGKRTGTITSEVRSPHNNWLTVAVYSGLIGLTVYGVMMYMVIKGAVRAWFCDRVTPMAVLLTILSQDMLCGFFPGKMHYLCYALVIAISGRAPRFRVLPRPTSAELAA